MEKLGALLGKVWQLIVRRIDSYLMAAALAIAGVGMITLVSASDQSVARLTELVGQHLSRDVADRPLAVNKNARRHGPGILRPPTCSVIVQTDVRPVSAGSGALLQHREQ